MLPLQIIKDIPGGPEKKVDAPKTYCLLNLFTSAEMPVGPMINIGTSINPKWYLFEIIQKFKNKKEAEDYAKKHKIRLAYDAMID